MASIRLGRYEVEKYELPPVCARCGRKAAVSLPKRFAWSPPWLALLILIGLLGIALYVILALCLTKRMTVPLPLCERHRNYWRNRKILIYGGLAAMVLLAAFAITLGAVLDSKGITEDCLLVTLLSTGGLFLLWLISAAVLQSVSIRPNEITDGSITLVGLSEDFVKAVRADRRGDEDDEDEDDRPRRKRPRDEDYEGRVRRNRVLDDDEDDRPRSKRRADEDDGGYYDPEAKRHRRDRDDDDR
jgi:hypothetical protein